MKRIIYLLIMSLVFISCKKDKNETNAPIVGHWEWFRTDTIYSGGSGTPQNTNRTWSLNFNSDYSCSQSGNLYTAANGSFALSTSYGLDYITINFPDSSMAHYPDFLSNDTLHFGSGPVADANQYYFVRVP